MMKLDTMWRFDAGLDGSTLELVQNLLQAWPLAVDNLTFFRSSANIVFRFTAENKPYFLRFNSAEERSRDQLEAEITLLQTPTTEGLNIVKPVVAAQGEFVVTIPADELLGAGSYVHGVVFEGLGGSQYDLANLEPHQLQAWGAAVAKVHQVAPAGNGRPDWQTRLNELMPCVPRTNMLIHDVAKDITTRLLNLAVTPETYGLIHFDAELDNIVWQAGEPVLLDFDDCCNMWFAADIAFALRDVFADDPRNIDIAYPRLQAFVDGYRRVRPLTSDDLSQLPLMLEFHNLLMFAILQRTRDSLVAAQHYPEWVHQLDTKLAGVMEQYQRQFEAYRFSY